MKLLSSILIPEPPVPWKAHKGYGRRSFNPLYKERECFQYHIRKQWDRLALIDPVMIEMIYYMPLPKGFSKKKKEKALLCEVYPDKRPDLDNLNKFLCDCLKGIVMQDDSQIVSLHSKKLYGENSFTLLRIFDLGHET